ncbi:MAG: hypothetical protein D6714_09760 [Bacteroidetes bacterium]|nr:MAG: hypothetical protein D6714_09760 [Bacteroidota bacterium]
MTRLILGTAMWGWTVSPETCFRLLDRFYAWGGRAVDTATNYPINKNPDDFRAAETILQNWIKTHGIDDLRVMMKVGSLNNRMTPDHNLTPGFLWMNLDDYLYKFGPNLDTFMVHWDNRDDLAEIEQTFEAFRKITESGLRPGISGIRHPDLYARLNATFGFDFRIQIKHNILHSDYARYAPFHGKKRFIAYGINAGGLKLNPDQYHAASSLKARGRDPETLMAQARKVQTLMDEANQKTGRPPLTDFFQIGLIYAFYHPDMEGILVGPSNLAQLDTTVSFFEILQTHDYADVYARLSAR